MTDLGNPVGRRTVLLFGMAWAGAAVACAPQPARTPQPNTATPVPAPRAVDVGLAAGSALLWASDEEVRRTLDIVARANVRTVRFDASWAFIEPYRQVYQWQIIDRIVYGAVERGLRPLITVTNSPPWAAADGGRRHVVRPADPAVYAAFAAKVAERYRGAVDRYEIWNEPNAEMYFEPAPDAAVYTEMVRLAYAAIKAISGDFTVVAGALGGTEHSYRAVPPVEFLKAMYDHGLSGYFDALSYHPYDYYAPLATGALWPGSPMSQMVALHDVMRAHGDGERKIWLTEYGAPSGVIGPDAQARLIADSLLQWGEIDYAGPFMVHTVRDTSSRSVLDEDTFGVVSDDFTPKPAFSSLRTALADGLRPSAAEVRFRAGRSSDLGMAVTPIFELKSGLGQRYEYGFLYETERGFVTAPLAVGKTALAWRLTPSTEFRNGYQDFGPKSELRVFSHEKFGTHAIFGAILTAWTPSLGSPTSDEYVRSGAGGQDEVRAVDFEHGTITWSQRVGANVIVR